MPDPDTDATIDPGLQAHVEQVTQPDVDLARQYAAFYATLVVEGVPKLLAAKLTCTYQHQVGDPDMDSDGA